MFGEKKEQQESDEEQEESDEEEEKQRQQPKKVQTKIKKSVNVSEPVTTKQEMIFVLLHLLINLRISHRK